MACLFPSNANKCETAPVLDVPDFLGPEVLKPFPAFKRKFGHAVVFAGHYDDVPGRDRRLDEFIKHAGVLVGVISLGHHDNSIDWIDDYNMQASKMSILIRFDFHLESIECYLS